MQHVARPREAAAIPRGVWALGFVSLFMDISSEMIHALLPVFLVSVLGTSVAAVGLLEGTAEAIAQVTKVFSGTLSDWLGKRKLLTVVGYGLAALTKPLFALAPSPGWVFAARGLDRVGKGIRGAPRDALIADLAPEEIRGAAFGLRQTLDTVGAFAGPLLAIALMAATADNFRTGFWLATIPAFVSVTVLVLFVREREGAPSRRAAAPRHVFALVGELGSRFWWLVLVATLFTLARFSEGLILKVADVG
jgi:sugar phosphate permease